ncbi:MAG: 4Fe-4S cluster-binding domain-containing protein, partial [Clostridia bacterium]|nr:4Fe-4S cluster-binding domain-containing protein [Clostridia bacterium]
MSNTTANIFDIQRNSFVDGPGIRTTVFFKGCNLHCTWCHNPESQSAKPEMMFYKNKCGNCGKCKEKCPNSLESC